MGCTVIGCDSRKGDKTPNNENISFHRFPMDSRVKEEWIKLISRSGDWSPNDNTRVCSLHFKDSCFRQIPGRRTLHSFAIPSIFPQLPASCQPRLTLKRKSNSKYRTSSVSSSSAVRGGEGKKKNKKQIAASVKSAPVASTSKLMTHASNTPVSITRPKASTNIKELENLQASTIIARVYHYLQLEYEYLKEADLNLPLSNILKRTAEATGVTEETVRTILQQEWRHKTDMLLHSKGKKKKVSMEAKEKALHLPVVKKKTQPLDSKPRKTEVMQEESEENSSDQITIKFEAEEEQFIRPHILNQQEMDSEEQHAEYLDQELFENKPEIEMETAMPFETVQLKTESPDSDASWTPQREQNAGYSKMSVARKRKNNKKQTGLGTSGAILEETPISNKSHIQNPLEMDSEEQHTEYLDQELFDSTEDYSSAKKTTFDSEYVYLQGNKGKKKS